MTRIWQKIRTRLTQNTGFSLIEVLISMAIFAIGITAVAALQYKTVGGNARGRMITEATVLAEQRMEQIMQVLSTSLVNGTTYTDTSIPPYTVTWVVSDRDLDGDATNESKRVDLTVSSPQLQGNRAVSMIFFKDNLK